MSFFRANASFDVELSNLNEAKRLQWRILTIVTIQTVRSRVRAIGIVWSLEVKFD